MARREVGHHADDDVQLIQLHVPAALVGPGGKPLGELLVGLLPGRGAALQRQVRQQAAADLAPGAGCQAAGVGGDERMLAAGQQVAQVAQQQLVHLALHARTHRLLTQKAKIKRKSTPDTSSTAGQAACGSGL